jgi:hypothetical protein
MSDKLSNYTLPKLNIGKLAVVRDVAGKARVVAITTWWIQAALKPLHNSLFASLRRLPTDGTFDQEAPLRRLIGKVPKGQTFFSFDLSSATDRLPLVLQRDILNTYDSTLGSFWFLLIRSIHYEYEGKYIKYQVGQPMGAYSSFAMLAITHHAIVRKASELCGIDGFEDYCVLGDDIVIANDVVAESYLKLMSDLGVSINLSKSVISKDFAEFAKKWVGHSTSLTPIGPGLILRTARNRWYAGALLAETWRLKLLSIPALLDIIQKPLLGKLIPFEIFGLMLWSVVGIGSWLQKSQVEASAITWAFSSVADKTMFTHSLWRSLLEISTENYENNLNKLKEEYEFFIKNWWRTYSTKSWPLRLLELVLKLWGPGFWIYVSSYESSIRVQSELEPFKGFKYGTWEEIQELASNDYIPTIVSIDWRSKEQVRELYDHFSKLNSVFERIALNSIPFGQGITLPKLVAEDPRLPYLNDRLSDTRSLN